MPDISARPFAPLVTEQRRYFATSATLALERRQNALRALRDAVREHERSALDALHEDLGKSSMEGYLTEVGMVLSEITVMLRRLKDWMRPRRAGSLLSAWPAVCRIYPEPLGVALIFSPWNYPFQLALLPLAAAVAAGNCVILKPSKTAPATAAVLTAILREAFAPEFAASVNAGGDAATALLRERFDFILYTGSGRVGHIVMEAAARHLTPVCLELGGKSPVIVAADAKLDVAAKRIAWGKSLNAGQTCIAPDYVWVDRAVRAELIRRLNQSFTSLLGPDPVHNENYGRIINRKAFDRLLGLTAVPLAADRDLLKIAPCVLEAEPDDPVMREEIFGPLLPVLAYDHIEQALDHIRAHDKPLALYLFTGDRTLQKRVLQSVPFGGGCINDTVVHASSHNLPFGGVGPSGMGRYHGKSGFELFSNLKSVLRQTTLLDLPFRYPPYSPGRFALLRRIIR
ncbi:MAG: aldehyde dehydrogenase family protein [Desulfovibrio sp.]|jgi:aldehyde dehydrogenase (NAD+)|nr:aldehyde dehydrogenase family protein [Desulfovibrio sp.]